MKEKFQYGRGTHAKSGKIKKFRCGRAMLMEDGTIKKLKLENGGGSRFCKWYNNYMNFDHLRRSLIRIFNLDDTEHEISLYDFQLCPLNLDQYRTVWEYINQNGLNCNSTVIYLCTREEVDDSHPEKKVIMKNKKKDSTERSSLSTLKEKTFTQAETNSSIGSIEYKNVVKTEPDSDQQQLHPFLHEYSFKNTSNHLVKTMRDIINKNNSNEILIQLFERFCIMHGFICSTIDPLQQNPNFQSINQSEHFNRIYNICHSIELLLNLNKDKLNQIQQFPVVNDSFVQFYQNIKIFRDQWSELIKNNKLQTGENDQPKNSKRSSTSLSTTRQEQFENSQLKGSKKIKLEKLHNDHNVPTDIAIYSSSHIQ